MAKRRKYNGLILPSDFPPTSASLKRQLLFFDTIAIASPHDKALVNYEEMSEDFPGMTIKWGEYANFPRSEGYLEAYEDIVHDANMPIKKGLIHILPHRERSSDDAGVNFMLYNSAISKKSLVLPAIPDLKNSSPSIAIPDDMLSGGGLSKTGHSSKYELKVNKPYKVENVSPEWGALAYLRLGRSLKYMRRANTIGYAPIAIDEVNHSLCSALTTSNHFETQRNPNKNNSKSINNWHVPIEVVDPFELESALNEMTWNEVLKVRKAILPKTSNYRKYIFKSFRKLPKGKYEPSEIRNYIEELRQDFESCQDELVREWEKFRIASICKSGGMVGTSAIGMSAIPSFSGTWEEIFIRVVGAGLVSVATLTPELKTLIPAYRKVKEHPLFFSTMLPSSESYRDRTPHH